MLALPAAPARRLNQLTRHIERTIGPCPMVFHEILSADLRLDLHIIPPQQADASTAHPHGQNFYTIVTSGISARPMSRPPALQYDDPNHPAPAHHIELLLSLPNHWPGLRPDGTFCPDMLKDNTHAWPIHALKSIARLPSDHNLFLSPGQLIPLHTLDHPPAPGTTRFSALLLLPSRLHPRSHHLVAHDDFAIAFYALHFLFPTEEKHLRRHGLESLTTAFTHNAITDLLNPRRATSAIS